MNHFLFTAQMCQQSGSDHLNISYSLIFILKTSMASIVHSHLSNNTYDLLSNDYLL